MIQGVNDSHFRNCYSVTHSLRDMTTYTDAIASNKRNEPKIPNQNWKMSLKKRVTFANPSRRRVN